MLTFAKVIWGARCGESARRVLLGETRSRNHAYSVRPRRESAYGREAPHRLPSSRLVSTILIDAWFTGEVQPRLRGPSTLVRFCDDFVMLFAHRVDAERVLRVLGKRLGRFGLQTHPDKTRLVDFRPAQESTAEVAETLPTTFVFLGFLHIWSVSRKGNKVMRQFTAKERLARSLKKFNKQCRRMMHWPLTAQHEVLCQMLKGHYGYFGITGNFRRLKRLHRRVTRVWRKWLSRRSWKSNLNWKQFARVLERFALPVPRIIHRYTST
jgi:RNA-directed DNA polymerase